jgi:hypothetical protein
MPTNFGSNLAKAFVPGLFICLFCALSLSETRAQNIAQTNSGGAGPTAAVDFPTTKADPSVPKKPETFEERLNALQRSVDQLQKTVEQQQETIWLLALQLHPSDSSTITTAIRVERISDGPQTPSVEDRLKKVESSVSQLGSIKLVVISV